MCVLAPKNVFNLYKNQSVKTTIQFFLFYDPFIVLQFF